MGKKFLRNVWVSYARAQQELIDDAGQYIEDSISDKKYILSAYLRKTNNSEPLEQEKSHSEVDTWRRYLAAGENIQIVVESIAISLRRVILLSPAYLKSEFCLWELCSCLTYSSQNFLFILDGIDSFSDLFVQDKLNYHNQNSTLAKELTQIYENKKNSMYDKFHLPSGMEPESFFKERLQTISARVSPRKTSELGQEILQYAGTFETEDVVEQFWLFLENCFNEWINNPLTKKLRSTLDKNESLAFFTLKTYQQTKINGFVNRLIDGYENLDSAPEMKPVLYDFAAILALLRLEPEWVSEMRDANPGTQFLRLSVPQQSDSGYRDSYEACLAAHAIQFMPISLTPGDGVPEVKGNTLNIMPPPQQPIEDEDKREQRIEKLRNELISRVTNKYDDDLIKYLDKPDWRMDFRAEVKNDHLDGNDLLSVARFYIDQKKFTQQTNDEWIKIVREIMQDLNKGAAHNRQVKVGVLQLVNKKENDIAHLPDQDLLQNCVKKLLECKHASSKR